jgi:hypothetical protein
MTSPAPTPLADIPAGIQGAFWHSMDRLFFSILAASLVLNFSGAACLMLQPTPPDRELALDEMADRFARLSPP